MSWKEMLVQKVKVDFGLSHSDDSFDSTDKRGILTPAYGNIFVERWVTFIIGTLHLLHTNLSKQDIKALLKFNLSKFGIFTF